MIVFTYRSRVFAWLAFIMLTLAALVGGISGFPTFGFLAYNWLLAGGLASAVLAGLE